MTALHDRTADLLLHRLARAQVAGRLPSVVAGVVRGGSLLWSAGRGFVDGTEPDADVQYRIGSITKPLTALLVMRLRDEGLVGLSDALDRHVPGTPFGDRTVGQLLSHTAGLQAETAGPWWERTAGGPFDALVAPLDGAALHRAGRRFHYSNLGFAVLGELVAQVRGRPWGDCLRVEVLEPLGMRRTSLRPVAPAASGWAVHPFADVVLPEPEHDAGAMAPAGQVWSTVTDLARFATLLAGDGGDVISDDTVAEMSEVIVADEPPSGPPLTGYGLGLSVLWVDGRRLVGHGGSMPGFMAGVLVDRECGSGDGAVILTNATTGSDSALPVDLLGILAREEPALPPPWRPAAEVDPAALEIVGPWHWGPAALTMRLGADGLLELRAMDGTAARESRFCPRRDGTWLGLDGYYAGETLRVVRHPDGTPRHLDLATFVLTRTPYDPAADVPGGVDPRGWRPGT